MKLEDLKQFPHIFRKITAKVVSIKQNVVVFLQSLAPERKQFVIKLLPLLFFTVYLLYVVFYPLSDFEKIKNRVIKNPQDFEAHLLLAEQFKNNRQYLEALAEIDLALKLTQNPGLLTKRQEIIHEINRPKRLKEELDYWNSIILKFPNYRDAYLTKALLEYRLKNFFASAKGLALVIRFDPNFEAAQKLKGILEEMGYQLN
ncbi:hypothetical protein HY345_04090 [Candidatus Microgenomates bacterium]|nr:hypothetical protein [Candidatus Microgenomates bacterium]